jgi:hypothetical protein
MEQRVVFPTLLWAPVTDMMNGICEDIDYFKGFEYNLHELMVHPLIKAGSS